METVFSSMMGFCIGGTVKYFGRQLIVYLGFSCITLGALAKLGYATIDTDRIEADMIALLDKNGDGKITMEDVEAWRASGLQMIKREVPVVGGFVGGLAAGWAFV